MISEKRMEAFEAVYSDMHDVLPDALKLHRFITEDSYSLPGLAHDYRMYCAALDSVVVGLPAENPLGKGPGDCEGGLPSFEQRCAAECNFILQDCRKAIEAAGVRVKS